MTFPDVRSLAPMRVNTTVIPVADVQVPPEVASEAFRHSGGEFASALVVPGAAPRVRYRTPAKVALDLIGLKALRATATDLHFAKFTDGIRDSGSAHTKYGLAVGATAFHFIRSISVADRGIAWADCEAILCSADGMTHPIAAPTLVALPTLVSQPSLHTLAPVSINGTAIGGVLGWSLDNAPEIMVGIDGNPGDGLLYPTIATYLGASPTIEVAHGDSVGLLATLGMTGLAVNGSTFKAWLRDYDATNHVALATGLSFTVASGRMIPVDYGADSGRLARGGLRIQGLSTGATHPVVTATGTVPTL